jgi:hypothetical protein
LIAGSKAGSPVEPRSSARVTLPVVSGQIRTSESQRGGARSGVLLQRVLDPGLHLSGVPAPTGAAASAVAVSKKPIAAGLTQQAKRVTGTLPFRV